MPGVYLTDRPVRRPPTTSNTLLRKIQRACRMSLPEPDLALNLDIADYINEKQGGTSYDACNAIVKLINSSDTHTAVFALALLDVLVKNCGYPIHLQISRKEFLNQLVRRFPENPPLRYSKVQKLILTAIEEWYQTLCKHAAYKDDLNYIRDMRRLLKYKGYIFPRIHAEDLAVLRPTDQLKTATEIQKEQEIAQAAKLEELIRSGKPEDLKEANKLMKIMAGFKEDNLIHAKQAINNELNKLRRKADLLNEMLNTSNNDEDLKNNETIEELYGSLKAAQPKFQKIIEEEQDDDNLVRDLLKFNDIVNQLLEKYSLIKVGNKTAASNINPESISTENNSKNTGGALANEINLIDFDDNDNDNDNNAIDNISSTPFTNTTQTPVSTSNDPLVDLLGDLSLSNDKPSNQGISLNVGEISLGSEPNLFNNNSISTATTTTATATTTNTNNITNKTDTFDLLGDFNTSNVQPALPTPERILVNTDSNIKIEMETKRESDSIIKIKIFITNLSFNQISDVTFALAVPKSMQLKLQPQSSSVLNSNVKDGITQDAWIENALINSIKPLKVKWKVNYSINGASPVENTSILTLPKI